MVVTSFARKFIENLKFRHMKPKISSKTSKYSIWKPKNLIFREVAVWLSPGIRTKKACIGYYLHFKFHWSTVSSMQYYFVKGQSWGLVIDIQTWQNFKQLQNNNSIVRQAALSWRQGGPIYLILWTKVANSIISPNYHTNYPLFLKLIRSPSWLPTTPVLGLFYITSI